MDQPEKCSKCNGKHFYRNEDGDWECFECSKIVYDIEASVQAEIDPKPDLPSIQPPDPPVETASRKKGLITTCPGCGKELYIFPWRLRRYPPEHKFRCIHCNKPSGGKGRRFEILNAIKALVVDAKEHGWSINQQFEQLINILVTGLKKNPWDTLKALRVKDTFNVDMLIKAAVERLIYEYISEDEQFISLKEEFQLRKRR